MIINNCRFYNDYEYFQLHSGPNWVDFYDHPNRTPDGTGIYWKGELSLVGLDKSGHYHALASFKYGFTIDKNGIRKVNSLVIETKVSQFHDSAINAAAPRFWTRVFMFIKKIFSK